MTTSAIGLDFTEDELLRTDPIDEPLIVAGTRCHGGLRSDGTYVSPRTSVRTPAVKAWQDAHRAAFGVELLDAPLSAWSPAYPNVAQAELLLRNAVRDPVVAILTRIGTVEGFGGVIRDFVPGGIAPADLQSCFEEDVRSTATWHLGRGLIEAHARDEAGSGDEAGHNRMWFAARDAAFEYPLTPEQQLEIQRRMGIDRSGGGGPGAPVASPVAGQVDPGLEALITFMIGLLFIEIRAHHLFVWAETLLAETDLVAGDGLPARLVSYIRQDEQPHVEYLRTVLSEMRDRTFVTPDGHRLPGKDVIGGIWDAQMFQAREVRDPATRVLLRREVEHALEGRHDAGELLAEFDALADAA